MGRQREGERGGEREIERLRARGTSVRVRIKREVENLDRGDTLFDDMCNYELCTHYYYTYQYPLLYPHPLPKYRPAIHLT